MEIKHVSKVWGSEEWLVNNALYCGKFLNLKKGHRCSMHHHKNKHETFYLLKGKNLLELNVGKKIMNEGELQEIVPLDKHRFTGIVDSVILEFSTHHEDEDSYREEDGGAIDLDSVLKGMKI